MSWIKTWMERELTNFINLYGREECGNIMKMLNGSKLFNENIEIALINRHVPDALQISKIVYSCSYKLIFAKKRKINFASLYFLIVLYKSLEIDNISINEKAFEDSVRSITNNY